MPKWYTARIYRLFLVAVSIPIVVASLPTAGYLASAQAPCSPRTNPRTIVTPAGEGRIQVQAVAGTGQLRSLRIETAVNGRVFLAGRDDPLTVPATVPARNGEPIAFMVEQVSPSAATTVPLVLVDDCGPFSTFVGAGVHTWRAPLTGLVRRAGSGQPVAGARVVLRGENRELLTGPDGRFSFGQLPVGTYTIDVTAPSYSPRSVDIAVVSGTGASPAIDLDSLATPAATPTVTATVPAGTPTPTATLTPTVTTTVPVATPDLPPDPSTVAPPLPSGGAASFAASTSFLYAGSNPVQRGVQAGAIDPVRQVVARGRIVQRDGSPLSGVTVAVLGHPELGHTVSRADGMYDLALNGGAAITLTYNRPAYLAAQRTIDTPWQDFVTVETVTMVQLDSAVTTVNLQGATGIQVARGNPVSDADGQRQATLLFSPGTQAKMKLPSGAEQPLTTLRVRATEFTVGSNGPSAMPALLPPTSGYTYAVELSVDEALAAGATDVIFDRPVPFYVENFLDFPVGSPVPAGYYDRQQGQWIAGPNGRVIEILAVAGGLATLDVTGDGQPDGGPSLADLGITDAERQRLSTLYAPGTTLWRVPITHFTPWDCNWPFGPPPGARAPGVPRPSRAALTPSYDICPRSGSIIECQNQVLGEELDVVGTPFRLTYRSDRAPGRAVEQSYSLRLTEDSVPPGLKRVVLSVESGGVRSTQTFSNAPNQTAVVSLGATDAYGRPFQSGTPLTATIEYVYEPRYYQPAEFSRAFAIPSPLGVEIGRDRVTNGIKLSRTFTVLAGSLDARVVGLGGWHLDVHHVYDPRGRELFLGDGARRSASAIAPSVIATFAGGGANAPRNVQATTADIGSARDVAVGPDGTVYVLATDSVLRVTPDGLITTVVSPGPGDLTQITSIAVGPDGSLYLGDVGNPEIGTPAYARVVRRSPTGAQSTVAGSRMAEGFAGDGGPATHALLSMPTGLAVAPDGTLYIADEADNRVRRVGTDGVITTVAGTGSFGFGGDGGPAVAAALNGPIGLALGTDGSVYVADQGNDRVRRIGPDGVISTVAGGGPPSSEDGDGGPATQARLSAPSGIAVGPDDSLYIGDGSNARVRFVGPNGIITTVAGSGTPGFEGDGGPAVGARLGHPSDVALGPDGSLYLADLMNERVRVVRQALPGFGVAAVVIPSADGREAYVFTGDGRHLRTVDALTGALVYAFGYDSSGRLASVTDRDGNATTVERDGSGRPMAIVAPGGQRTTLQSRSDGYLTRIADPAGAAYQPDYDADGLLTVLIDQRGGIHRYAYDSQGYLARAEDPAGRVTELTRTTTATGFTVVATVAGAQTRFSSEQLTNGDVRLTQTDPTGAQTVAVTHKDGSQSATYADGTAMTIQSAPDPRFGFVVPVTSRLTRRLPSGLTETILNQRVVTLADPLNPLSVVTFTDTMSVNGRAYVQAYDEMTRTRTLTSPEGRQSSTTFDARGHVVTQRSAGAVDPFVMTYDARGRMTELRQGARVWTYGYDAQNRLTSQTDAEGKQIQYLYDVADRLVQTTLPSGRIIRSGFDDAGVRTSLTMPSGAVHSLGYSTNDEPLSYTPPGNGSYSRTVTPNGRVTRLTLPSGRVDDFFFANERPTGNAYAEAAVSLDYAAGDVTDRITRLVRTPLPAGTAQEVGFVYDGSFITEATTSGVVQSHYQFGYDANLLVTNVQLTSGVDSRITTFGRDLDGLVTSHDGYTIARAGPGGAPTAISDSVQVLQIGYDSAGRVASRTLTVNSQQVYDLSLTYDTRGRLSRRVETTNGVSQTYDYLYDDDGYLLRVTRDSVVVEQYEYDLNGNRTLRQLGGGAPEAAAYDSQDRIASQGTTTYVVNADGFLAQRGSDTYTYSTRGELLQATVAGQTVTYAYDAFSSRRVARTDATGTTGYLYGDVNNPLRLTDIREPSGELTSLFYDDAGLLIGFQRGGVRYRVAVDQVGSPRVVTDAAGTVLKTVDYDSFGNVTADSAPGFAVPLGFAGGVLDPVTGLLNFVTRDYDPVTGRWTARDQVLFEGGHSNLYVYAGNSPVAARDPFGLWEVSGQLYALVGGGFSVFGSGGMWGLCSEFGAGAGTGGTIDLLGTPNTGPEVGAEWGITNGVASLSTGLRLTPCGATADVSANVGPAQGTFDGTQLSGSIAVDNFARTQISAIGKVYHRECAVFGYSVPKPRPMRAPVATGGGGRGPGWGGR